MRFTTLPHNGQPEQPVPRLLINIYKSMGGGWLEKAEAAEKSQPVKEAGFIP